MEKIKKLEAKRILSEYSFVKTNDEYLSEIISVNTPDFLKQINDYMKASNIVIDDPKEGTKSEDKKKNDPIYNLAEFTESTKSKMKKIYRDIVKLTHPDKVSDERLNAVYIEAKNAYYHNDIMELFYICDSLKIEVEIEEPDIVTFRRIMEEKKKRSSSMENSYLWLWVVAPTEEAKMKIVKQFVEKNYK